MSKPNYSKYTMQELLDCKSNIVKDEWPERYQEILHEISVLCETQNGKLQHDEIVFSEFCDGLRDDLTLSIDDNYWPILKLFSKSARNSLPSTFRGEVCPVCKRDLSVSNGFWGWLVACKSCALEHVVRERMYTWW